MCMYYIFNIVYLNRKETYTAKKNFKCYYIYLSENSLNLKVVNYTIIIIYIEIKLKDIYKIITLQRLSKKPTATDRMQYGKKEKNV